MAKFTDLTNRKFGKLTVVSRAESLILANGKPRTMWLCVCECGNRTVVSSQSLIQGTTVSCGCVGKEKRVAARNKINDLTGQRFGRLLVLYKSKPVTYESGAIKTKWHCQCDCGNEVDVFRTSLIDGRTRSCGCSRSEITSQRGTKDITNQHFGKLTAIERDGKYKTQHIWKCQCECGNICNIPVGHLLSGHTSSCGCDRSSRGESIITQFLVDNGIQFKREYTFDDLRSAKNIKLRFDFALMYKGELKCLIEYQGQQHYKEVGWKNFGSMQRQHTDKIKRLYCKQHNIPLYEIRYDENIEYRCMEIFINIFATHENSVPSSDNSEKV